jgi:hypothetical protein
MSKLNPADQQSRGAMPAVYDRRVFRMIILTGARGCPSLRDFKSSGQVEKHKKSIGIPN